MHPLFPLLMRYSSAEHHPTLPHPPPCFFGVRTANEEGGYRSSLFFVFCVDRTDSPPLLPLQKFNPVRCRLDSSVCRQGKTVRFRKIWFCRKKGRCQNSRMDLRFINCTFVRSWYIGSKKPSLHIALFDQNVTSALRQRNDTRHFIFCLSDQGSKRSNSPSVKSIFLGP